MRLWGWVFFPCLVQELDFLSWALLCDFAKGVSCINWVENQRNVACNKNLSFLKIMLQLSYGNFSHDWFLSCWVTCSSAKILNLYSKAHKNMALRWATKNSLVNKTNTSSVGENFILTISFHNLWMNGSLSNAINQTFSPLFIKSIYNRNVAAPTYTIHYNSHYYYLSWELWRLFVDEKSQTLTLFYEFPHQRGKRMRDEEEKKKLHFTISRLELRMSGCTLPAPCQVLTYFTCFS